MGTKDEKPTVLMDSEMTKLRNESDLDRILEENDDNMFTLRKPVLLDFYADWCGPCRMVAPIVHEIAEENDSVVVAKINVDDEPDLAIKFGVMSIPTLVVMKNGEEVNRATGARAKPQILAMLG